MRARRLIPIVLLPLLFNGPVLAQDEPDAEITSAADAWLVLVDAGDYDGSWEVSGRLMQENVTAAEWRQALESVQAQLSVLAEQEVDLSQRVVVEARRLEDVPNLPDGEYAAVRYRTAVGEHAFSEVVTMQQEEGSWRVIGYFVAPEEQP